MSVLSSSSMSSSVLRHLKHTRRLCLTLPFANLIISQAEGILWIDYQQAIKPGSGHDLPTQNTYVLPPNSFHSSCNRSMTVAFVRSTAGSMGIPTRRNSILQIDFTRTSNISCNMTTASLANVISVEAKGESLARGNPQRLRKQLRNVKHGRPR